MPLYRQRGLCVAAASPEELAEIEHRYQVARETLEYKTYALYADSLRVCYRCVSGQYSH
jgi:hypothetical protein